MVESYQILLPQSTISGHDHVLTTGAYKFRAVMMILDCIIQKSDGFNHKCCRNRKIQLNHVIKKDEFSFAANIPNIQKKNPGHTITELMGLFMMVNERRSKNTIALYLVFTGTSRKYHDR